MTPQTGRVHHAEWGHGVVMSIEQDRLTVLFDEVGYRTLSLRAVQERGLLTLDEAPEQVSAAARRGKQDGT